MPNPATLRERRLRKTKAQLIDEIDRLERRAAATEAADRSGAPMRAKAGEGYLANLELADLARFPSENPSPVLRVMPGPPKRRYSECGRPVRLQEVMNVVTLKARARPPCFPRVEET